MNDTGTAPAGEEPLLAGWRLKTVAFTGGAVLMGLEISGARILAPHFGGSVYVWGALFTVFLSALAAGYYGGGILADRAPRAAPLAYVLGLGGALVLFIPQLAEPVCRGVFSAGPKWGPLAAALVLFAVPSYLLAMVSPLCLRLFTRAVEASGRSAGVLYTVSTVGSLLGTFAATFVFVYFLRTPHVMYLLGLVLLAAGVLALAKRDASTVIYGISAAVLAVLVITLPLPVVRLSESATAVASVVDEVETPYHRIFVTEGQNIYGPQEARYLQFDRYKESGIVLEPPYDAATKYTDLFHLAFLFVKKPRRVLFIGGGGMIGPRKFTEHYPFIERIDVVEIDPAVVRIAEKYFHFRNAPPVHVTSVDGRVFVARAAGTYDLVVLDIFSAGGRIPFHLTTVEFFRLLRARLSPRGVCLMNVISSIDGPKSKTFHGIRKVFEAVFPQTYAFPRLYHRILDLEAFDRKESRNVFLAGTMAADRLSEGEVARRGESYTKEGFIPAKFDIDFHGRNLLPPGEPKPRDDVPVLTDELNPVELWKFW